MARRIIYEVIAGDNGRQQQWTIRNKKTKVGYDVSTWTVFMRINPAVGTPYEIPATKTDPTNGVVVFEWSGGQIIEGEMDARIVYINNDVAPPQKITYPKGEPILLVGGDSLA